MGFQQAQATIEQMLADAWQDLTPIAHENDGFDPRNVAEWIRITVKESDGKQASCGSVNRLFRYPGVVFIQIFTEAGKGSGRALELADLITPIFRSVIQDNIHFGVPVATRVGPSESWYQVNVDCNFYREEFD